MKIFLEDIDISTLDIALNELQLVHKFKNKKNYSLKQEYEDFIKEYENELDDWLDEQILYSGIGSTPKLKFME